MIRQTREKEDKKKQIKKRNKLSTEINGKRTEEFWRATEEGGS